MSWIAEYDTHGKEFPTCVHVTKTIGTMTHGATYVPIEDGSTVRAEKAALEHRIDELCQENEQLRQELAIRESSEQEKVIDYLGKECVDWEDKYLALAGDNAKLRELVVEVFKCARRGAACETCKVNNDGYACVYIMQELGIEVPDA